MAIKTLRKKLDKLWRTVGKEMATCAICQSGYGKIYNYTQIHPHHLISRRKSLTRWELMNRMWLCPSHHTLSDQCVEYNQKGWFWGDKDWLSTYDPQLKKWLEKKSVEANATKKWKIGELRDLIEAFKIYD